MSVCLVGSWAKIPNGKDGLEMAENIFLNRDNIKLLPDNRDDLHNFREKHPDVKAALVDDIGMFDDQYFGTGESEAICMDPQQRMLMQGVINALESSGITIEMASQARVAVYTAAWTYDYKDLLPPDQYMATGNSASVMCGRITYFLNSRGAAVGIETACSSSLVAFHLARQAILSGETKLALVCGANHIGSRSFHSLYNSHMVSPNGRLAAFDRSANGFVRAESFAVAVLCSKQFAEENGLNIHCECIGSAFNSDGKTPSLTAPNPISQYEVQLEAMGDSVNADSIQLVTCHGTGTKLGDQVELTAIKKSFKPDIRVMSPKSSMGHGEGAAGLIGVLQSLYSMNQKIIPNQLHLQLPSEDLGEKVSMAFVNEECDLQRVAISSYGFGGTNACAIIEQPKNQLSKAEPYAESKVLFLSAKCMESLKIKIEEYGFYMTNTDSILENILFSENDRKTKYDVRAAVYGKNRAEIASKLISGDYVQTTTSTDSDFEVEFGEGNEKLWLLRMLYESNHTFQAAVDKYCGLAETCGFPEARTALFFPFKLTLTPLTYNVSRLISSMATFELLINYETLPTKVSGRGLGQIFALAASKAISFEDAVQLMKTVIAEADLTESIGKIDLKSAKVPIDVRKRKQAVKKITPLDIVDEINAQALPNLMSFKINGREIEERDPVKKFQSLFCHLFVAGFDPLLKFRGTIVKTPGYAFLKRRFWPETSARQGGLVSTSNEQDVHLEEHMDAAETSEAIRSIVKKFLDIDEDDVNLMETGAIDSLTSIEMIEAIGSAVNHTMPFDLLESYPTTKNIIEFLQTLVLESSAAPDASRKTSHKSKSNLSTEVNVIAADFSFAGVNGEKELWDTLLSSKLVTEKISETRKSQCGGDAGLEVGLLKQDISLFDNSFFSVAKDEAEFIDPQHRLLLHSAYNALEKSGLSSIPDADLFLAISSHSEYRAKAEHEVSELDERLWMGTVHSMAAGRLASLLGIRGRAVLVDTTCSSIATALEMALQSIREGKKYAVVATSQLIQSSKWLFSLKTLLDHQNTKSFSVDGSGFCRSDGVGVIILKAYEDGDSSIVKITEAKTHHSGAVITPVVSAISSLLDNIGQVSYIEGHGTATIAGDSAESMAYQKIGSNIVMSSVKAQFGHCEVASGLIQLMKVSSLTNKGIIPAVVHNYLPNEHIRNNENLRLPFVSEECDIDKTAIVSFGITGTKTVVTTEKIEGNLHFDQPTMYLLPISAKTKDALKKLTASFIHMLQETNETLFDISKAMQEQKTAFKWRSAVVGSNHREIVKKLENLLSSEGETTVTNWHVPTFPNSIGCVSFMENIEGFDRNYTTFCNRLRFEPNSDQSSIYHTMSVVYALMKEIIEKKLTTSFAVSGFNGLILLSAIDAAPAHYLNDLIHAFAKNDVRMMKRIARDITIQVDGIELFDFNGQKITTARQAVDAASITSLPTKQFPENTLLLSSNETTNNFQSLQTVSEYYNFIGEKYVGGTKVDFTSIFGKATKIVDLPEYPFNRKPFWLPITEKAVIDKQQVTTQEVANFPILQYEFLLNSEKWKHVRNHVVDSQIVLPGATSIRLTFELHGAQTITMSNIDFLNKIVPKEAPMLIQQKKEDNEWTLSCDGSDAISFKLYSKEPQNLKCVPNDSIQAEIRDIDEIYLRFSKSHLTYRNEFQMIDWIRFKIGRGEAHFVELDKLDILIDGTLQAIVLCYFFENSEDESPFVPFTIERITILDANLKNKKLHAVVKYESSANFVTGDATVYDNFGNVIIHMENVSFKRLHGSSTGTSASKTVMASVTKKGSENEQAKRESRNMLHAWFEDNFGWTDIDDTTGFFDLGLTSIQAVKLRNAIKSNFPDASSTCVFDYPSIKELSAYLSTLVNPIIGEENQEGISEPVQEDKPPTRLSTNPIGVMAAACRLPGGISCPAELWELLKIGKNASSRIPATRVPTRNSLIAGTKYGNPVEGGNFIKDDVSMFDPAFFKISKSEAELIDPQQRILLECVQECLENSGVTETGDVGVFVGLMEKEYQDMMESSSILAMLGSMAAVIAGRINYVFGCHGPSVTIDTACSSSLVALEMAVNALLDGRCSRVLVAGVNLILNERGQGLRTNGKMLSHHGMSLSFDSRASGYGRSDGCVVLMLELAKPNFHYMSTVQAVNVNHGGRSVSLTAPNGVAHKMLLTSVINQSPSLAIDYWEAHGTGTPLGDPIEFNTLSSILQNILIGSVKASLGHGEASAGTCGLLKLFLMLTNQYVPTLIHFHVLNKDINAGSIRLPIIGEEAELTSAGISSFGVSGTNAAAIVFNDNSKLEPYIAIYKYYILPISAKNQSSLDQLEKQILSVIPVTDVPIRNIASALANNRSHFAVRNALIVNHSGKVISRSNGKLHRIAKKEKYRIKIDNKVLDSSLLQFDLINELFTVASLKNPTQFAMKYALVKFLISFCPYVEVVPQNSEDLLIALLADGTLKWDKFDAKMLETPIGSLLNDLAEQNINSSNDAHIKSYHSQPEAKLFVNHEQLLEIIVYLYVNGYELDWSSVYSPVDKFVVLPNYHFNKQSLWFEERKEVVDHYLIGTVESETDSTLFLKNMLSELRHPQLFNGKPIDVGTVTEIAIEALKTRNPVPISIQNLSIQQIVLTKPVWLKTVVEKDLDGADFTVKAYIDDQELFSMTSSMFESEEVELPVLEVGMPEKVVHLKECPSAIVRRSRNQVYVDSRSEVSPFRTANIVLNELIGFIPNPSDIFLEVFGVLTDVYYMVQVDDGALWQFQIISQDKHVLSNIYVLKDAKGLEIPTIRMHKKSTLLSSQEAQLVALKTLQMDIINKVKCAFNDVIDSDMEIDESQMSTGFTELGMDSLATVDLLNRLNQKYFPEIELTTSDLFDNPNITDLAIRIEEMMKEKGIEYVPSASQTPKVSVRERKLSIPAHKHQEVAQIEFVNNYNKENNGTNAVENEKKKSVQEKIVLNGNTHEKANDREEIKKKISLAVLDLATDTIHPHELETKGFTELGMDSLSMVDFVNRLNEKYFPGEDINTSDVFDYPTVNELADHIAKTKNLRSETEQITENGFHVEREEKKKIESEKKTTTETIVLDQSFLLVSQPLSDFVPTAVLCSSSSSKLEIRDMNSNKLILDLENDKSINDTLVKILSNQNKILVKLDGFAGDVGHLYMALLNLVKAITKSKMTCIFAVSTEFSLGNSVSRAFLKTVAAEKFPLIDYVWDQRIQQVEFEEAKNAIEGNWMVTGGLSGIGFEIGRFLANNGAKNVILLSRRNPTTEVQKNIQSWNAKVHTIAADVNDKKSLIKALEKLDFKITGIIHSAGVLKDSKIERQTKESFDQVFKPKANGMEVLEQIEEHFNYKLDNFIMMSSFTAACGNEGQLNYGVANSYLEHQVKRRRREGKSGCAIQWGNWIDTGMATNANVRKFLADLGFLGQHNEDALKYLRVCIEKKPELLMVANIDWKVILKNRQDLPRDLIIQGKTDYKLMEISENPSEATSSTSSPENNSELSETSIEAVIAEEDDVLELVKAKISELVKVPANRLKNNKSIMDIGMNSHLLSIFLNYVNDTFDIAINLSDAYNYSTLEKLAGLIWDKCQKGKASEAVNGKSDLTENHKPEDVNFCQTLGVNVMFDEMSNFQIAKDNAVQLLRAGKTLTKPETFKFALPITGQSVKDVIEKINSSTPQKVKTCSVSYSKTVLMLTGQGSQYPMMGKQLCEQFAVFKNTLESCLSKCDKYLQEETSLWEILFNTDHYQKLQLTTHMQPIMFSFGYACAKLWLSLGIRPDFYLGHSVGELVAGVLSGIMSIDEGLELIVERGKAMESIAGLGGLLAVQREIADDVLRKFAVCVATVNSPKQVVFAGTKDELDKALAFVKGQGKQGTFVNQKYPFHSNIIQDSHLENLRKCLRKITFRNCTTPLVSNVSGQIIHTFTEDYIIKHTVSAVKFVNCVETLVSEGVRIWIDAGPAAVLATFVKRIIPPTELTSHRIVQTCREKDDDAEILVQSCLELEQAGSNINWPTLYGCNDDDSTNLLEFPVVTKNIIEKDEFSVLKDHKLNGRIIIAGAYQMYKIDELLKMQYKGSGVMYELKNVKFLKPWYIEEGIEFEINWNPNMTIDLIVNSEAKCSAKIDLKRSALKVEDISANELEFDVHDFYETLYANGLQYENGFRKINNAKRTSQRCFANLDKSEFLWPLIDSAMHSITASVIVKRPNAYFLPVAMSAVVINALSEVSTGQLKSQAIITSENEKFIQVNVILFSNEKPIVEVRNMTIVVMNQQPKENKQNGENGDDIKTTSSAKSDGTSADGTVNHKEESDGNSDESQSEIQIVGLDVVFPFNSNHNDSWQFLKSNRISQPLQLRKTNSEKEMYVNMLDMDVRCWDPEFFGIRPSEAPFIDPQQRLILSSVAKLLDSVGLPSLPTKTGIFIGCSTHEFSHIVYAHSNKNPVAEWSSGTANSSIAGRIAYWLKVKGPVLTVDTACASSMTALSLACDSLNAGKCDYAIVGTINLVMHEMTTNVLKNAKMIVKDFCKVFDVDADGYKRSEAICTMLLSRRTGNLSQSSLGLIVGWSAGHNGNSSSFVTPNGNSQVEVMKNANHQLNEVHWVESHCTGTKLGDPIELQSIAKFNGVKTDPGCHISSIKSNIGHCEGSSGLMSLCALLLQNQGSYILPQMHLKCVNSRKHQADFTFHFVGEEMSESQRTVQLNNFGFTGSNCSLVVKLNNQTNEFEADKEIYTPMLISANCASSLENLTRTFQNFIESTALPLNVISHLLYKKKIFKYRMAIIYNYKRKEIWRNGMFNVGDFKEADIQFSNVIKLCQEFLEYGKTPLVQTKIYGSIRNSLLNLPTPALKEDYYWKMQDFSDDVNSEMPHRIIPPKNIFFEKTLVLKPRAFGSRLQSIVCFDVFHNYPLVNMDSLRSNNYDAIIFEAHNNPIDKFSKLLQLWKNCKTSSLIIVCCPANGTNYTEWIGVLKSLTAEKEMKYKFVSYETLHQLEENFTDSEIFESIFYREGKRFVERLCKVERKSGEPPNFKNILAAGGSGGIMQEVLRKVQPCRSTIISRSANQEQSTPSRKVLKADVRNCSFNECFDGIFHFAGTVDNATHWNMTEAKIQNVMSPKYDGVLNLAKLCDAHTKLVFSSSIAAILGSYGQSNYAFANGLVTSFLEKSDVNFDIVHWGPWKEHGMLARQDRDGINHQIEITGWKPLSTNDALSIFDKAELDSRSQTIVFDGDFEVIYRRQKHLQPFLSEVVESVTDRHPTESNHTEKNFESIFKIITGFIDLNGKENVPLMDLGIDSLCLENLRSSINVEFNLDLTISDMFENATFEKLQIFIEKNYKPTQESSSTDSKTTEVKNEDNRIAVIGWSAEFSDSENIEEFWKSLVDGKCCTSPDAKQLANPNGFDNKFFNITDEDSKVLDSQVKRFIQHAYLALENSGYIKERNTLKCSVFAGAEPSSRSRLEHEKEDTMRKLFVMNMNNYLASYAAFCLDLKGEAVSVYSACSTTLVAICQAVQCLQQGRCDLALAGAASIIEMNGASDEKKTIFSKSGVCRPFDVNSEGIVQGSGVGCFVLKKLCNALADGDDVKFVIREFGLSNDGNSRASFMAPNPAGQLECMKNALSKLSDCEKQRINYIECHATGTTLGDTIEMNAVKSAYSFKSSIAMGSCKANIGHLFAASGMASLIKTAMMLKTNVIPPQINFSKSRQADQHFCEINRVKTVLPKNSIIAVNSFGIGGTNCHMIIESSPQQGDLQRRYEETSNEITQFLIPISAKSAESLKKQRISLISHINNNIADLPSIQKTLLNNREHHDFRSFLLATQKKDDSTLYTGENAKTIKTPKICFFFAPQGLQYSNNLRDDFDNDSVFKRYIEQLCKIATKVTGQNFMPILYPDQKEDVDKSAINDHMNTQIAMFIQCLAIARTLEEHNISASLLAGHSLGEYVAGSVAGVLDESSMITLLHKRSKLIARTQKAAMVMVWNKISFQHNCEVSSILDEKMNCVVGTINNIALLKNELNKRKMKFRDVKTTHGFHSSMMKEIALKFGTTCRNFSFQRGLVPIISSIDGLKRNRLNSEYFQQHLIKPVNMSLLVDRLISEEIDIVLEIGPSGVLANLLAQRNSKIVVIPTCGTKKKPIDTILKCIGTLWAHGMDVTIPATSTSNICANLPGYIFDDQNGTHSSDVKAVTKINDQPENKFHSFSECWIEVNKRIEKMHKMPSFFILNDSTNVERIPSFTSILVHQLQILEDVHSLYFTLEALLDKVLKESNLEVFVLVSDRCTASHHMTLGLLRCQQLKTKVRLVFVENYEHVPIPEVLEYVSNINASYLKVGRSSSFELAYRETTPQITFPCSSNEKRTAVVFGASGTIGSVFVDVLRKQEYEIFEISKRRSPLRCNLEDLDDVKTVFKNCGLKNIDLIINCTGLETFASIEKHRSEKLKVLSIKTIGNLNILKAVATLKLNVHKLIICSSMSSVIPIFGNSDYASANCFVEGLCKTKHECFDELLTIAFPPIEESRMYQQTTQSVKHMLKTQSMDRAKLHFCIEQSLALNGPIFVASENPEVLKSKSQCYQQNGIKKYAELSVEIPGSNVDVTSQLIEIWKKTLGSGTQIDDSTNFFAAGGDSLSALQLVWQIEKILGKTVHVDDIFKCPTLAEQVMLLSRATQNKEKTEVKMNLDNIPLTNSQTQMFVLRQIDTSSKYNVVFKIQVQMHRTFQWKFFKHAILSLIAYQNSLRTTFANFVPPRQTVRSLTESYYALNLKRLPTSFHRELDYTFDIEKLSPLRILINRDSEENQFDIVFNQHHILTDGWSMTVLAKYVTNLYIAYSIGSNMPHKLDQSMSKLAIIENSSSEESRNIDCLLLHIGNCTHSVIPYDIFDSSVRSPDGYKRYQQKIPERLWNKLIKTAKSNIVTPYNIAMTLFSNTIQSFIGSTELLFAYADSGRNSSNSDIIGYCMNNLLFKCDFPPSSNFSSKIRIVSKELDKSRSYSSVPFFKIVERKRDLGAISIYFNFRQKLDFPSVSIPDAICEIEHVSLNNAFDFSFTIDETPSCSMISVDYDCTKYQESTIRKFLETFLKTLNRLDLESCNEPWEQNYTTKSDFPADLLSKELIAEWQSTFKNLAVFKTRARTQSFEDFSYKAKNSAVILEKSYQTSKAMLLREDDMIGICSREEESSLIACMILGVAYVPIKSSWPEPRRSYILKMIQHSHELKINSFVSLPSRRKLYCRRSPFGALYSIFTSGSTGMPKGVMLAERSVAAFIASATKTCGFRQGLGILNSVQKVFDVSVSNIFGAFANGCHLIGENNDGESLELLENCHYAFLPTAIFHSLSQKQIEKLSSVELITIGGESVTDVALSTMLSRNSTKVIQIYGPTETCIWSLTNRCFSCQQNQGSVIGRSINNERCRVKHNYVRGELLIDGISLARGYLSTTDIFGKPIEGNYSTGDIVDLRENKTRFIGRKDNQTKWKGILIDILETEKEISKKLRLQQIKLLIHRQMLIAFLVGNRKKTSLFSKMLADQGQLHIPDHFVELKKMPLNSSGKIDKTSLLQAFEQMRKSYKRRMVTMTNSIEDEVISKVAEVIGGNVSLEDKFVNIGGNSLSAIQVAHLLTDSVGTEIKAHDILQHPTLKDLAGSISAKLKKPESIQSGVITKLREVADAKVKIYLVHAIGGTIYPYYSFLQIFPKDISIYGIEFDLKYPCADLKQLARFYANEIAVHAGSNKKQIFVMGHSMGGIMSREIVAELKIWGFKIPFVMMFDSWVLRTNELDIENIKSFLNYVFSGLPDSECRIDRAVKLAELLREYQTTISDTKLYLFKSKRLGDAAFKKAVRTDLSEELARSMTCNGFDELSTQAIDSFLIDGDHESCLKVENLKKVKDLILAPFKPYL